MKKIIDVSEYPEQLGFIPQVLEPMMKAVRDSLNQRIPKGWVVLRVEEVPDDFHGYRSKVRVTTTLTVVKAPRIHQKVVAAKIVKKIVNDTYGT